MGRRWAAAVATASLALLRPRGVRAEEAPASLTVPYSHYELVAIHDAEVRLGSRVDLFPEGKTIESIETVRLDPIEERDPAPLALNVVHVTTKEDLVLHEVLLRVGTPYRHVVADESARNIRRFMRVSIVAVVPFRGSREDRVRVVVVTKDVWSLIVDTDFHVTSGGLEHLMLEIEETNLFGRQTELSAHTIVQPESIALGAIYLAPRFAGRFLSLHTEADVIINRRSGQPEGSYGDANIQKPLFSTRTSWAWSTGVNWRDEVYRLYSNAAVAKYKDVLPWAFRSRRIEQSLSATRSYGWARKNDLTLGTSLVRDVYRVQDAEGYDPAIVADFTRQALPVGEVRSLGYVQWRAYANDFLRIVDFETMGLQEDYRLGYDVVVRAYPVVRSFGSTRDLVGVRAGGVYTIPLGDGFVRGVLDTTTESESKRIADASVIAELRIVSPRTPIGRVVFDMFSQNRWRNYLNRLSLLGGEDRLRGWPTRHFVGANAFAMNLEYRTRPIEILSVLVGAAAFYDVGRAYDGRLDEISPAHSVGAGFRIVLPQIDRSVIRGDFGFPLAPGGLPPGVMPMSFYFAFGQAFRSRAISAPFGP